LNYRLSTQAEQAGHKLRFFADCGSTNDEAMRAQEPVLWVVTDNQTKGRGRHGRAWVSPSQNLAVSFAANQLCEQRMMPQLCFVAGLAMVKALQSLLPDDNFQLKWPNDILLNGAKLCGILIEASSQGLATRTVIGWGVNMVESPQNLPYPTAHLNARLTRETLFTRLTQHLDEMLTLWQAGENFKQLTALWLKNAAYLNQTLCFMQDNTQITGKFIALTPEGGIRLETEFGIKDFYAGEITIATPL
jgi:biotin-[acetyl-CoA-carboxylase] ligase BirA-like protein